MMQTASAWFSCLFCPLLFSFYQHTLDLFEKVTYPVRATGMLSYILLYLTNYFHGIIAQENIPSKQIAGAIPVLIIFEARTVERCSLIDNL